MSNMKTEKKIKKLEDYLKNKKCVLAFSAGSDSTLLAYILSKVSPNSLLATIDNNMMPREFIGYTEKKAEELGLNHKVIKINFLEDPEFISNNPERCYNCRKIMYKNIQDLPEFNEYDYFLEGTNLTDLLEDRPGILVRKQYNMTSPLIECEITKDDVYEMIDYLNLEYSNNTTCLATRIKTNENVNQEKLDMVYEAEELVKKYIKQENIRVRFDNYTATISVDNPLDILEPALLKTLRDKLQNMGFKKICLDITGYSKTNLTFKIDEDNTYYYILPYNINLEKTYDNIKEDPNLNKNTSKNGTEIHYGDVTINKSGKINISPSDNHISKFNKVLTKIERDL